MSENIHEYKEHLSQVYSRAAPSYDQVGPRFFSYFGRRLVEWAGLYKGASVLDVGCGRGAILLPAAERVGQSGRIVGVDLSAAMAGEVAKEVEHRGLGNTTVHVMDAEAMAFPDAVFDFLFSGFVLFLLPNLDRALCEALRVLRPGGKFLASVFGDKLDERWDSLRELTRAYRGKLNPIPQAKTTKLYTLVQLEDALSNAGFVDVKLVAEEKEFHFENEEEWCMTEWSHGGRVSMERMDSSVLEEYKRQALAVVGQLKSSGGIPIRFEMLLAKARARPARRVNRVPL